jgi:hypothetical protein
MPNALSSSWKRWRAKHGIARGVALYSLPGYDDPQVLADSLGQLPELRQHAAEAGLPLHDNPDSLADLDRQLDHWQDDPKLAPRLGIDVALYLGTVLVRSVPGACWQVWPNGQPVVAVTGGRELDVIALAHDRLTTGTPTLPDAYRQARQGWA